MRTDTDMEGESWATTTTSSPTLILRLLILQKREDTLLSIRQCERNMSRGSHGDVSRVHAMIRTLWREVRVPMLQDKNSRAKEIRELIKNPDIGKLDTAFEYIDEWLYKKGLTKFDIKGGYDMTRGEVENARHGL